MGSYIITNFGQNFEYSFNFLVLVVVISMVVAQRCLVKMKKEHKNQIHFNFLISVHVKLPFSQNGIILVNYFPTNNKTYFSMFSRSPGTATSASKLNRKLKIRSHP